jgi:hypothetical protein
MHRVQDIVRNFPLTNQVFTLDALHCQKKQLTGLRQIFVVNRVKTPARQGKDVKQVKRPQTHTHQGFNCFRGKNNTTKGFQPFFPYFFV